MVIIIDTDSDRAEIYWNSPLRVVEVYQSYGLLDRVIMDATMDDGIKNRKLRKIPLNK